MATLISSHHWLRWLPVPHIRIKFVGILFRNFGVVLHASLAEKGGGCRFYARKNLASRFDFNFKLVQVL